SFYLDGGALGSDSRSWDAMAIVTDGTCERADPPTCDVLLSAGSTTLGGLSLHDEDIVRCHPTAWTAGGAISACSWSMFFRPGGISTGGFGAFNGAIEAFEFVPPDEIYFRPAASTGLPAHQAYRDLLRYKGTLGTSPKGTVTFFFDGSTAGLDNETIHALGFLPDRDAD